MNITKRALVLGAGALTLSVAAVPFSFNAPKAQAATTPYTCSKTISLYNPYNSAADGYFVLGLGWQESKDANGTPEARIYNSTSIVVYNYANNGTTPVAFEQAVWDSTSAGIFQITDAAQTAPADNNIITGGELLGIRVNADGTSDDTYPGVYNWRNTFHKNWGWRQYLAYAGTNVEPEIRIALSSGDGKIHETTKIYVHARGDGTCGNLSRQF
jgi:hypothetical protein